MQFADITGSQKIKDKLLQEAQNNRVSHAQLFLGNEGNAKLALALAFIQYLMCENPTDKDSCGSCMECKRVAKLEHPDLHFSFPTAQGIAKTTDAVVGDWRKQVLENPYLSINDWISYSDEKGRKPTISVHEAKNIIQKLTLKSFGNKYKIMLIWMAEWMRVETANKLLKIIEEPPQNTLFFLLADQQDDILPTILSRTQLVHVARPHNSEVEKLLLDQYQISSEQAATIALMADGNINKAIGLVQHHEDEDHFLDAFISWMRVCYKKNVVGMIQWSLEMAANNRAYHKTFLEFSLHMVQNSIHKNYAAALAEHLPEKENQFLDNFARFINGKNVLELHALLSDTHYQVDRNANAKILFTDTSFQIMRLLHRS